MFLGIPYLIYYSEIGPDFINHHEKIYENFYSDIQGDNLEQLESFQKLKKKYMVIIHQRKLVLSLNNLLIISLENIILNILYVHLNIILIY